MKNDLPDGYEWDPQLQLGPETEQLTKLVWPNYLIEESDIPEPSLTFQIDTEELMRRLPVWGIRRKRDRRLVANASALKIPADLRQSTLPAEGWRFAMKALGSPQAPTCLCLIAANVDPEFQSLGLARHLLEKAKAITFEMKLNDLVGPVRPVLKSQFPMLSFEEFLDRKNERGETLDPWLRLHERMGAERWNVCRESVVIRASLEKWREWTGLPLLTPGAYEIAGGLAPLQIDLNGNLGAYIEPNVWVRYRV